MYFREIQSIVTGMRIWVTDVDDYHFVIVYESGAGLPADQQHWVGYSASYKPPGEYVEESTKLGRFPDFPQAVRACQDVLDQRGLH